MKASGAKQLALVLIVAFGLRLAAGWLWQSTLDRRFAFGDSGSYWALAQTIARGEPYRYGGARVFRTPGYPALLAPLFVVAGGEPPVLWARAQSALFGTLAVAGVWWLGRELFGRRAGLVAAAVASVYPGALAMSVVVLSEAPFCPLMLAHLILWIAAWRASSAGRAAVLSIVAGLAAGAATLVRPSWMLFTPFAVGAGLALGKPRMRHLGIGAAMLAGLVVAMMPWWVRNARLTGHFVPTTLQVGASLYDGWNPQATGASDMRAGDQAARRFAEAEPGRSAEAAGEPAAFEYRLDRHLRAESLSWAQAHPARVFQLAGIKLVRLWNLWPNEPRFRRWYVRIAMLLTYLPVMLVGAVGIWRSIHRGWPYVLCWLPAVYFTLLHVVFVSSIRYRQPPLLTLMVLAAGVIVSGRGGRPRNRSEVHQAGEPAMTNNE